MPARSARFLLILITGLFLMAQPAWSQRFFYKPKIRIKPEKWYVSLQTGPLIFQGDLKQKDYLPVNRDINELRWGIMLSGRHNFSDNFNLQFRFLKGSLAGMEEAKNRYFTSRINEYSFLAHFNLNRLISKKLDPELVYIYAFGGVGITSFRSKKMSLEGDTLLGVQGYELPSLKKKKATREAVFPGGFGFQFNLNRLIMKKRGYTSNFYADLIFNLSNVNTDKIDVEIDPLQGAKDRYWSLSVGITYRFGKPFRSLNYSTGTAKGRGDISSREPMSEEEILQQELLSEDAVRQQLEYNKAITTQNAGYRDVVAPSPYSVTFRPEREKLDDPQKIKVSQWKPVLISSGKTGTLSAYLSVYQNTESQFQKTRARLYHLYSLLTNNAEVSPDRIDLVIYIYTDEKSSFLPIKSDLANRVDLRIAY